MKYTLRLSLLFLLALLVFPLSAQKTPVNDAYHYTLENGLELFIMENSSAPLAYIEIAVKAGGIAQTKENAGVFHLYEHMMFKGNTKYPSAAAVQRAIADFGVSSWNGSTGSEYVNYFFTVPAYLLKEGLEFWSYAIREPLLDPAELENEKKVVVAEIEGGFADPNELYSNAVQQKLFPKYPWRLDPGGTLENIKKTTVQDLKDMQRDYYIPNNSALFVGGDVKHEEVYKLVKEVYGSWKKGDDPWKTLQAQHPQVPFAHTQYVVQAHPQISPQFAQVAVYYRGPDTATDVQSTYPADVFMDLLATPRGKFKQDFIANPLFSIPSPEYIGAGYGTQRETGVFSVVAVMLSPEQDMAKRVVAFGQTLNEKVFPEIMNNKDYFAPEDYQTVKQRSADNHIFETETAAGFLSMLRFWWISASSDYYFSYADSLSKVSCQDISQFIRQYLYGKPALVTVLLNPQVYQAQKASFDALGFEEITEQNAFWWLHDAHKTEAK